MKPAMQILALSTALVAAIAISDYAHSAPIDDCSRPVLWKTLTGKCNEAQPITKHRAQERVATPNKPDKPDTPNKPDKPSRPDKPSKPDKPGKPDKPNRDKHDKDHGNASANNGKGGNYDRTGHHDNGKGRGRDHK